jgi:predicted Zn-dependent peptidase
LDFLADHAARLESATRDEVAAAAAAYLAPSKAVTVVLGDASVVAEGLATLATVDQSAAERASG